MADSANKPLADDLEALFASNLTRNDLIPIAEYARERQTAVLVILFTDIKGSTELAEIHGELFSRDLRHKHDEMLRSIFEEGNSGRLIKTIGDALMYVFAQPSDAVSKAVEAQQKLAEYNAGRPADPPLLVRIGMHMGQVLIEKDLDLDIFGRHVNRAARVESLAAGGQILVTHAVYDSARGWLEREELSWHDHGEFLLKGIPEPIRIMEVCPKGTVPRCPVGKRPPCSRSWFWPSIAAMILALALVVTLFAAKTGDPTLEVKVRRGDTTVLAIKDAVPIVSHDEIRIRAEFPQAAYCAIIAIDENGIAEMLTTSGDKRVAVLQFPEDVDSWIEVTGEKGTETIIALESSKPIAQPPSVLESKKWKLPDMSAVNETLWISPGEMKTEQITSTEKPRSLGRVEKHETHDLHLLVDQLRHSLADQSLRFRGVVYPHQ